MKNKFIVKIATLAAIAVVGFTPLTVSAASCTANSCSQGNQTTCVNTVKSQSTCKTGTCKKNNCKSTSKCNKKTNKGNKKFKACKGTSCVVKVAKSTCKK